MKKISLERLSRAVGLQLSATILSVGLAGAVMAPSFARAATPANVAVDFIDLIDQTTGDFCSPETNAVTPNGQVLYVAANDITTGTPELFAINTLTNSILASIILPFAPINGFAFGVAIDPAGQFVYVSVEGTTTTNGLVYVVRIADNAVVRILGTTTVGPFPLGLAVAPNGKSLWIANSGTFGFNNGTVSVVELTDGFFTPSALIAVGGSPNQIVFSPNRGKIVYAENDDSGGFASVINANTGVITNPAFASGLAFFPFYSLSVSKRSVFIGNEFNSVLKLNTHGVLQNLFLMFPSFVVDTELGQTAVTTDGKFLYVAEPELDQIGWVNLGTNTPEIFAPIDTFGAFPYYLAINPSDRLLYVSNIDSDDITVILIAH
jgi:DNA-binding beta-propeller fold protein YncE